MSERPPDNPDLPKLLDAMARASGYAKHDVILDAARDELLWHREQAPRLEAENNIMRALLAYSSEPCLFCGLPADDMSKCALGFPGCGRADDMMLAPGGVNPWPHKKTEPQK